MNTKSLLTVNDVASRNSKMLIETSKTGKEKFSTRSIKDSSENGRDEIYWLENQIDCTNDNFMVREGLRHSIIVKNQDEFVKSPNDRFLIKKAKASINNKLNKIGNDLLRQEFVQQIANFKGTPKFNFSVKIFN